MKNRGTKKFVKLLPPFGLRLVVLRRAAGFLVVLPLVVVFFRVAIFWSIKTAEFYNGEKKLTKLQNKLNALSLSPFTV